MRATIGIAALAAGPGAVRKQVEASMLVTGTIQIDTAGKVTTYALDQQDKLPAGVIDLIGQAVPHWTFQPVLIDGRAANVRTDMSIRVVARKIDADNYSVGIRSAGFGARSSKPGERVRSVAMAPPRLSTSSQRLRAISRWGDCWRVKPASRSTSSSWKSRWPADTPKPNRSRTSRGGSGTC